MMRISFLGEGKGDGEKGRIFINNIYEEAVSTEAEFLDVIRTKVLRVFLIAILSRLCPETSMQLYFHEFGFGPVS